MVSWGKAFRKALAYVIWTFIWGFIGILLVVVGILGVLSYGLSRLASPYSSSWAVASLLIYTAILALGLALMKLASTASYLKISTEMIVEEISGRTDERRRVYRIRRAGRGERGGAAPPPER